MQSWPSLLELFSMALIKLGRGTLSVGLDLLGVPDLIVGLPALTPPPCLSGFSATGCKLQRAAPKAHAGTCQSIYRSKI